MELKYNDGGRAAAGFTGSAGDCVVRSIAIVTGKPYQDVYADLKQANEGYVMNRRGRVAKRLAKSGSSPRNGSFKEVYAPYLESLGFKWTPTMTIGSGCQVHLRAEELPKGRILARVSRHLVAVVDGVINDTHDCSRQGTRCVYGYYSL